MITKNIFRKLVEKMGFTHKDNVYQNKINNEIIEVDFNNEKISYPNGITVEGEFTTNFHSAENFVVFECVHRLLCLGYKPKHLTLEPKWKLGHGASGGRADIVIRDNDGKVFAIIECKTAGKEFDEAWSLSLQYPSQLFSYAQQEGSTQIICLYTSDWENDEVTPTYYVIQLKDNESNITRAAEEEIKLYKSSNRFDEKFNVWKDTYHQEAFTKGFFEEGSQPFTLGKRNYSINDLKEISHSDIQKKYHEFATILRQYNVSGRENAFDKLVNLFLCKVVDEKENPTNLKFYWKGLSYDSHFDLQDRLQLLYTQGMYQFLGEEVTYINQEQIDEAFTFLKDDPDATRETIQRYFKQLKFFTNNDFAFIDVHNEKLFYQNAKILLRIVEMLQNIKLKSDSDEYSNQFLGDMFEGFLDAGVKQSEGQFFTPMPIVKFIMNSLPLEELIAQSEQPPKAIDYACGAGHFLTELARQITPLIPKYKGKATNINDYYSNITGIEKEYRLSKVAKVSAFMYGQDDINITYADALAKNEDIKEGDYQILVANPPYSVKGFLETLTMPEKRSYQLYGIVDNKSLATNNAIETFFIERAKQLLAPGGIAAIILPSSILSNDARIYQTTREILLKHFHIIAIAELGSGTFGKTGTNTVTLFLRRRKAAPAEFEHYKNRVDSWLYDAELSERHKKNKLFQDLHLLEAYCKHVSIVFEDYKQLWSDEKPNENIEQSEIWQEYVKDFYSLTETKNLQKRPNFKSLKPEEQKKLLDEKLVHHVRKIEHEKLYFFLLAYSNPVPVLIIKSPADNKAMKKFLGYEWSAAKGNEGIKYLNTVSATNQGDDEPTLITAQLNAIQTALYNPANKDDDKKLNYYIQQSFHGKSFKLPEELADYSFTSRLVDMLDFSRRDFNKAFSLSAKNNFEVTSKWEVKKLGEIFTIIAGQSPESTYYNEDGKGLPFYQGKKDFGDIYLEKPTVWTTRTTKSSFKNDILISVRAPVGDVNINPFEQICIGRGLAALRSDVSDKQKFYFEYISLNKERFAGNKNSTFDSISTDHLAEIKVPIPPDSIAQTIVAEFKKVDEKVVNAQEIIEESKEEIEKKIQNSFEQKYPLYSLLNIASTNPSKSEMKKLDNDMLVSFVEMAAVSNNGFIERKEDRLLKSVRKGSYTYFADNDIIIAKITPCMENGKCALANHLTNGVALGSSEFHVIRSNDKVLPPYLFYHLNRQSIRDEAERKMTGSSGHRRVPISFYENLKLPIPRVEVQQKIVDEIEILEAQIATAQNTINNAASEKQAILKKWLE